MVWRRAALSMCLSLGASGCSACDPLAAYADAGFDSGTTARDAASKSCNRDGNIDNVEREPECAVACADPADPRFLRTSLENLSPKVLPGGTASLVARIKNVATTPVTICFRTESVEPTGWDRVAGITTPLADTGCERPRLTFLPRTLGNHDASVDELKVGTNVLCTRTLRVVLMPGRTLTRSIAWSGLRLPPAPRPWEDDAGNRYYPKTVPVPLSKGTYRIEVDVPFFEAPIELRRIATSVEISAE